MKEIIKIKKLLDKYKKKKDDKIKSQLVSYVIKCQTEIFDRKINDRNFRPTSGDEFQDKREILKEIREELDMLIRSKDQYPPRNIDEIRDKIKEMGKEQQKQ